MKLVTLFIACVLNIAFGFCSVCAAEVVEIANCGGGSDGEVLTIELSGEGKVVFEGRGYGLTEVIPLLLNHVGEGKNFTGVAVVMSLQTKNSATELYEWCRAANKANLCYSVIITD